MRRKTKEHNAEKALEKAKAGEKVFRRGGFGRTCALGTQPMWEDMLGNFFPDEVIDPLVREGKLEHGEYFNEYVLVKPC